LGERFALSFSQDSFLPHSKEKNMKVATHKKRRVWPFRPWRLLIGCMKVLFLKLAATIFGLHQ
jgi:hypothetical protein